MLGSGRNGRAQADSEYLLRPQIGKFDRLLLFVVRMIRVCQIKFKSDKVFAFATICLVFTNLI